MKRIGQFVFVGAVSLALVLYWLTAPDGLPWNGSTHLALAYLGEIVRLPAMPHPVWGCYVQVFGGSVALSVALAALAAGLVAVLVNRYFGWRFAVSVSLVWIFLPGVWNRAITGERGICLAAMAVVAAWVLDGVARCVLRKAREVWAARKSALTTVGGDVLGAPTVHEEAVKRGKVNRIAGWVTMGAAGLFAVVSLTLHDYRYGEAASVFAKGVVAEAGERIVVLNGVCDDQVVVEVKGQRSKVKQRNLTSGAAVPFNGAAGVRALPAGQHKYNGNVHCLTSDPGPLTWLALRSDDVYRTNLLARVRSAFPTETNLWVAAQVSAAAFAEVAAKNRPERFYLMNGSSATLEGWERRWEDFKPYLTSRDPFVPVARRMFGYEGNAVANAMLDEGCVEVEKRGGGGQWRASSCSAVYPTEDGRAHTPGAPQSSGNAVSFGNDCGAAGVRALPQHDKKSDRRCPPPPLLSTSSQIAWRLYKRIYTEVDPGNLSALVNMSEMIRRGYAASGDEKKKVQGELEKFFKDAFNRKHAREIARAAGPVRADPALVEKMAAEAKKRIVAKIAVGEKAEYSPEFLSLVEWNNEMVQLMDKGELVQAGRIARAILSNPKWQGFVPANAVMGSVAAFEGDYAASEMFFRVATETTNAVPAVVLNDYADTLIRLGKVEEAERQARRAVAGSDASLWVARLTLAEVLERREQAKARGEERKVDEAALSAFGVGAGREKVEKRGGGGQHGEATSSSLQNKNGNHHCPPQPAFSTSSDEIRALLKSVLQHAPAAACDKIRKEHREYVR